MKKKYLKKPRIKEGEKFRYYDRCLWHIVGMMKDGDTDLVVIKSWNKYKQAWMYKAETKSMLQWWFDNYNKHF